MVFYRRALAPEINLVWQLLFTVKGRVDRATWWIASVAFTCVWLLGIWSFSKVELPYRSSAYPYVAWLLIAFLAVVWWSSNAIDVKRLHDRERSGWHVLIRILRDAALIALGYLGQGHQVSASDYAPILGIVWVACMLLILVECGFLPGTDGPNNYGPDPLVKYQLDHSTMSKILRASPIPAPGTRHSLSLSSNVADKYALLIKYSEKVRALDERLRELPDDLRDRLKRDAVSSPGNIEEIAASLVAENHKRECPFEDPKLDALHKQLEPYGPGAQSELRRVIGFLRGHVDADTVVAQIIADFRAKAGAATADSVQPDKSARG